MREGDERWPTSAISTACRSRRKTRRCKTSPATFCIVGCGYKAISWEWTNRADQRRPTNFFGVDLTQQQQAETANWFSPAMYNIVKQNGREVHLVIKPDKDCEVNSGLGSIRGARQGELSFSTITGTQGAAAYRAARLSLWRHGADLLGRRAVARRRGNPPRRSRSKGRMV